MKIEFNDVRVDLGSTRIVDGIDLTVPAGALVGVLGPNGSGKTTLLKTLYRAIRPVAGTVAVDEQDVWARSARDSARRTSVVLQDDNPEFAFTVRETVQTARVPHQGRWARTTAQDRDAVGDALRTAGVDHLADRLLGTLSGGERQRVYLARALAQQTPVMVLDEPTNHLDVRAQIELLELLRRLPLTVVAALHDLNLAAAYCDHLYLVKAGRVVASGPVARVVQPAVLMEVYGVASWCTTNPLTGRLAVHFGPARPEPDPPPSTGSAVGPPSTGDIARFTDERHTR
ncbi:ABC transporter ATP-binding protein [Nakamurella sp.]|uniref:ABC transporter ATP-binding protein n=1 Tax=Nakamurella sp. TaxID=1869182 RepID=UPI003784832E